MFSEIQHLIAMEYASNIGTIDFQRVNVTMETISGSIIITIIHAIDQAKNPKERSFTTTHCAQILSDDVHPWNVQLFVP